MAAQPFEEQAVNKETVCTRSVLGGAGVVTRASRSGEGSRIPPLRGGGRRWEELSVQWRQGPGECPWEPGGDRLAGGRLRGALRLLRSSGLVSLCTGMFGDCLCGRCGLGELMLRKPSFVAVICPDVTFPEFRYRRSTFLVYCICLQKASWGTQKGPREMSMVSPTTHLPHPAPGCHV